jgi:hypothetical protein
LPLAFSGEIISITEKAKNRRKEELCIFESNGEMEGFLVGLIKMNISHDAFIKPQIQDPSRQGRRTLSTD